VAVQRVLPVIINVSSLSEEGVVLNWVKRHSHLYKLYLGCFSPIFDSTIFIGVYVSMVADTLHENNYIPGRDTQAEVFA